MGKALVLGSGGLRGAYSAGVTAMLCRKLGPDYFDAIYVSSVGAYAGCFYAAGQPDIIEQVWREHVHGNLLVNPFNALRGESILDLDYLIGLFQQGPFQLHAEAVIGRVCVVVTDCKTAEPSYYWSNDVHEVFLLMRATTAIPLLHPAVRLKNGEVMDGSLTDPLPIARALADGHECITVVCNKARVELNTAARMFLRLACLRHRKIAKELAQVSCRASQMVEILLQNETAISVIRPRKELPFRWALDSSKERINYAFDLGVSDALTFLKA